MTSHNKLINAVSVLSDNELTDLVSECYKLTAYIQDTYKDYNHVRLQKHDDGSFSCLPYDCSEQKYLKLNWDGSVKMITWEISGHNGDPYGKKTHDLDLATSKKELTMLKEQLLNYAIYNEKCVIKENEAKKLNDEILANIQKKLKEYK